MKKLTLMALLLGLFCLTAGAKGKQPIAIEKLPRAVKAAAMQHYTPDQILFITMEKQVGKDEYEFSLADGTKVEFYENGQLHKIKSQQGVPDAFIPENMLQYIKATFPNSIVTEYKNERMMKKIEINNDVDLVFNRRGKFLRID